MKVGKQLMRKACQNAPRFAALGDETRLMLVLKLGDGGLLSITRLTEGTNLTRQAITKHLHVLEEAGLVRAKREGRQNLFQLQQNAIKDARETLDNISQQWDEALASLKAFVER